MNRKCDILIIGAGILGCFAARSLSRYALNTIVLEKREDVCCGISRANTGIIYQGYDQHPGSLKARLCVNAGLSFPRVCEELDIRYRKCGLMMLSFGPNADRTLHRKLEQGKANGIDNISIIGSKQIYEMEPLLCEGVKNALYSENTYTVNPWEMGIAAFENAVSNNVHFFFNEEALKLARSGNEFIIETQHNTYTASRLLCCAGLSSGKLWELVCAPKIKIVPMAADYIVFDKCTRGTISHVISVEPEEKGEGLTLVPTVNGNILAGPTRRKISGVLDFSTDIRGIMELREKSMRLVPSLSPDLIIRSFGAVRPNPYLINEDGSVSEKSINDFTVLEDNGFFDLAGIKTPGITCAYELGEYIARCILASMGRQPSLNPSFSPYRKRIPCFSDLVCSEAGSGQIPADYTDIICRCEQISKAEITEAIRRGAGTVDGIKRRTGAGMGRCQGGYCMEKILHLLADYTERDIYQINKDGPESRVLSSK